MAAAADPVFSVSYRGPATEGGRMDVGQLVPALLAMRDLIQEAYSTAYPGGEPITLEVRSFRQGSFDVVLQVVRQVESLAQQSIGTLNAPASVAAATLITFTTALFG